MVFQNDTVQSLFNEWFVYDFKLSNGKTPLEDFIIVILINSALTGSNFIKTCRMISLVSIR
ncbi:MAG: hypothetical protein ACUVQT_01600, partial [bacterium]